MLLNIELRVPLVFVINANGRQLVFGLKGLKTAAIAVYSDPFNQLVFHNLPVIDARASFIDEIPAIKIAVLEYPVFLFFAVENEFRGYLDTLFNFYLFSNYDLQLDVLHCKKPFHLSS